MSLQQQLLAAPQTIDAYSKDNKYYIKTFLVNDQLNLQGWKLNPNHIQTNIRKFIGRPLILTPYVNHPHEFKHYKQTGDINKDKEEFLKLQEKWKIGDIVDVFGSGRLQQGSWRNEYTAIIEVQNENAIRAIKEGKIPKYVSPSILRVNGTWEDIRDFEALHLAIVDNPAFGIEVANIRRPCEGNMNECLNMLHQGGAVDSKDSPITECPYEVLCTVNNLFSASQTLVPISLSSENNAVLNSEQTVQQTESPKNETVGQEQNNVIDQKISEQKTELKKAADERTPIGTPKASSPEPANVNPPGTEEQREGPEEAEDAQKETPCQKAAKEYEAKILELEAEIKASKEFRESYLKEQKRSKTEIKKSKIENAIPKDYADSEEERAKVIDSLQKIPDADLDIFLEKFVVPATSRKVAAPRKHTEFLKNAEPGQGDGNVAQASAKKNLRLKELNRVMSFTGISSLKRKEGINS